MVFDGVSTYLRLLRIIFVLMRCFFPLDITLGFDCPFVRTFLTRISLVAAERRIGGSPRCRIFTVTDVHCWLPGMDSGACYSSSTCGGRYRMHCWPGLNCFSTS